MLLIEKITVMNMENALRGARNPLDSWAKSDSFYDENGKYVLGEKDLSLAMRLMNAGSDHRKFLRQIFVSADITGPLYWWKEFDTYKVGTVANSTSTMHTIQNKSFTKELFSCDKMTEKTAAQFQTVLDYLEQLRQQYLENKDKTVWYDMIQFLPSSFNQLRTVTFNYENLINMYRSRTGHKLHEWHTFCEFVEQLPYAKELIIGEK